MKNCCDAELPFNAFVAVMVKGPFAVSTLVTTGNHWLNGDAMYVLPKT